MSFEFGRKLAELFDREKAARVDAMSKGMNRKDYHRALGFIEAMNTARQHTIDLANKDADDNG